MFNSLYKKIILLFLFLSITLAWSQQDINISIQAQQGPMTLEKNFKLADRYPIPSAWLLANACAGCHGTDGAEMDTVIPPIAGMDKKVFIEMMKAYQSEKASKSIVMTLVAKPLTSNEISAMAEYFSQIKASEWTQKNWNKDVKVPNWAEEKKEAK